MVMDPMDQTPYGNAQEYDVAQQSPFRHAGQQSYFWLVTRFPYPDGKLVIIGPKMSNEEATEYGFQKLDSPFEVKELQTRDRARATSIIKAQLLSSTGDLGGALQRSQHQPPSLKPQPQPPSSPTRNVPRGDTSGADAFSEFV